MAPENLVTIGEYPDASERKLGWITTTGAFALVQRPVYGGGIFIALGRTIIFASGPGLALVLVLLLDLKSRREEIWVGGRGEAGWLCPGVCTAGCTPRTFSALTT